MTRPRALTTASVLLGLTLVAAAFAVGFTVLRLPDPATADREGLLRWVVSRDLEKESETTRAALASRLDEEFGENIDWDATSARIDQGQRAQVWSNLTLLLEPWFRQKVREYRLLAESDRTAYLDTTIDRLTTWSGMAKLQPDDADGSPASQSLFSVFQQRIECCKEKVDPAEREQLDEFQTALQARWLIRTLLPRT